MLLPSKDIRAEADRIYRIPIDQGKELDGVYELLARRYPLTHGFIEIGAGGGGSFHCWGSCIPLGPKISVDYYNRSSSDHVERTWGKRDLYRHREAIWRSLFEDVWPVFAPSAEESTVERVAQILQGRKVDFLFIDGRWQDIDFNYWRYAKFVRSGGIIGVHCVQSQRPDAAPVREFWEHLKKTNTTAEFAYGPHRSGQIVGGTGVVFVK